MPLDPTITVGEKTFALTVQPGGGVVRINTASTLAAPDTLAIRHERSAPKNADAVNRHNVINRVTVVDSDGVQHLLTVSLTIGQPEHTSVTNTHVKQALAAVFGVFLADDFAMTGLTTANQEGIDKTDDILLNMG